LQPDPLNNLVGSKLAMTSTESKIFKHNGKISIPSRLANFPGARFILIDKKTGDGKKPLETKWNTEKNYAANHPKLIGHIRGGGNYGVATGYGWLQCFDADEMDRLEELGIIKKLPKTFTSQTGGHGKKSKQRGRHYWYKIEGMKKRIIGYDPELKTKDKTEEEQNLHLLDVQSLGNYAIGPNSTHKSGKKYKVIDDSPIAEITFEQLMGILTGLKLKRKDDRPQRVITQQRQAKTTTEVSIEDIAWPDGNVIERVGSNGKEIQGSHPIHGSQGGKNFSINPSKGTWYCHRCESGGGWVEFLAMKMGLINCAQAGPKCLSKSDYRKVMQYAEEQGIIKENVVEAPEIEILLDKECVVEIPNKVPEGKVIVLKAPPRTGKTWKLVKWLNDAQSGNYITNNHAIVEHAVKIARELKMRGGVWVVGINQPGACVASEKGSCATCQLKHNKDNHFEYENDSRKLMWEKGILTVADVPSRLCPYYTLKAAEAHAKYCFTVVNNINNIMPRDLVLLDEEPVLDYFYATSIEVATIKDRVGDSANKNYLLKSKQLQKELEQVLKGQKQPKLKEYALKINEISSLVESGIDDGLPAEEIASNIEDTLLNFTPKHREVREEGQQQEGEDLNLETCIRCLGHLYKENPVSIARKPGGYLSIYLLGDERETAYNMGWFEYAKKVVLVGATKAEMFAKEKGGREIEVETFRYDDRFTIIGVDKANMADKRGSRQAQKKKVMDVGIHIWKTTENNERTPFMVLTGSKKEQEKVISKIVGAGAIFSEREQGMEWEFASGKPVVFFQNSIISRGLDVDQYNLILVYGCNFAQPFWSVANPGIAAAIIADETTNSVLRISPTLRNDKNTMKLVIMQKEDVSKVKYISNTRILTDDAKTIALMVRSLSVCGKMVRKSRGFVEPESFGVTADSGKESLKELISNSSDIIDEEEVKTITARIIDFMRKKRHNGVKRVKSGIILDNIKVGGSDKVTRRALQELYHAGRLKLERHGKEKDWSLI
jgi:hypothetical protein